MTLTRLRSTTGNMFLPSIIDQRSSVAIQRFSLSASLRSLFPSSSLFGVRGRIWGSSAEPRPCQPCQLCRPHVQPPRTDRVGTVVLSRNLSQAYSPFTCALRAPLGTMWTEWRRCNLPGRTGDTATLTAAPSVGVPLPPPPALTLLHSPFLHPPHPLPLPSDLLWFWFSSFFSFSLHCRAATPFPICGITPFLLFCDSFGLRELCGPLLESLERNGVLSYSGFLLSFF